NIYMILIVENIAKELKQYHAVDLESYESRFLLKKIKCRMADLGITVPGKYLTYFQENPDEARILIREIGISVSLFFRNPFVYSIIEQQLLPSIIEAKRQNGSSEIRVWSAGCATGEEPYSIAILLHRLLEKEIINWKIHIFATDIGQKRLTTAAAGVFHRDKLVDTKLENADKYFSQSQGNYRLKPEIRKMVNFSLDDLASTDKIAPAASIFGSFDLVLCRNVMIYFNNSAKTRAVQKFIKTLNSSGYLILGESEWIDDSLKSAFIEIDQTNRIYKKK
ncbi:MAG: protein-glutamate O-methyltransferase CheR, partial [Deltaproteobacteria bacterium]|nr:protein-glutamate O-methyltransferase CheR [Deltaproteobacteria bacterium]